MSISNPTTTTPIFSWVSVAISGGWNVIYIYDHITESSIGVVNLERCPSSTVPELQKGASSRHPLSLLKIHVPRQHNLLDSRKRQALQHISTILTILASFFWDFHSVANSIVSQSQTAVQKLLSYGPRSLFDSVFNAETPSITQSRPCRCLVLITQVRSWVAFIPWEFSMWGFVVGTTVIMTHDKLKWRFLFSFSLSIHFHDWFSFTLGTHVRPTFYLIVKYSKSRHSAHLMCTSIFPHWIFISWINHIHIHP